MLASLPNLHPAVVHFPIVLVPLAVVMDVLSAASKRASWRRLVVVLWMVAAASATLAVLAGQLAADGLADVPARAQAAIGRHADWAYVAAGTTGAVAIGRAVAEFGPSRWWGVVLRIAGAIIGLLSVGIVWWTADLGGGLVYQHRLGVQGAATPIVERGQEAMSPATHTRPSEDGDRSDPLLVDVNGTWTWVPVAADAKRLGTSPWPVSGAAFDIEGATSVVFEPDFGDVQLDVRLDVREFSGEVRLLHHVRDGEVSALTVRVNEQHQEHWARLLNRGRVLDSAAGRWNGAEVISVNAVGTHIKGIIDGKTVVHGHATAVVGGRVGLELEGAGRVVVERVEVVPLNQVDP